MCKTKRSLAVSMVVLLVSCYWSVCANAQSDKFEQKVVELKSLELDYEIDLNQIFISDHKSSKQPSQTHDSTTSSISNSLELVGTLILGKTRMAWLKVDGQFFQLEQGQFIPGLKTRINQINPDFVVIGDYQLCENEGACDSSLTLTIRDALF